MNPTTTGPNYTATTGKSRRVPESSEVALAGKERQHAKLYAGLIQDQSLSDAAFRLYAELRLYAWESTGSDCTVGRDRLSEDLGWSDDKIRRSANELVEAGLVERIRTGRANRYVLKAARSSAPAPTAKPQKGGIRSGSSAGSDPADLRDRYVEADEGTDEGSSSTAHATVDSVVQVPEAVPVTSAAAAEKHTTTVLLDTFVAIYTEFGLELRVTSADAVIAERLFAAHGRQLRPVLRFALGDHHSPTGRGWTGWRTKVLTLAALERNFAKVLAQLPGDGIEDSSVTNPQYAVSDPDSWTISDGPTYCVDPHDCREPECARPGCAARQAGELIAA